MARSKDNSGFEEDFNCDIEFEILKAVLIKNPKSSSFEFSTFLIFAPK